MIDAPPDLAFHNKRAIAIAAACGLTALLASGCFVGGPLGLGSTASARLRRADLFTQACVGQVGDNYVVCGSAERMLADESDADLLDEARLDAEARLAGALRAGGLELSALTVAHTWTACGGRMLVANFSVPRASVHITSPQPLIPPPSTRNPACPDDF